MCREQLKRLYGPVTDIPKIPENIVDIFTAEDGKERKVGRSVM